jgi:hypothetical protein
MSIVDELAAVIDDIPETHQAAARELVEALRAYPEGEQLAALKALIADRIRAIDNYDVNGDGE